MADETKVFEAEAEATRERIAATMDDLQNRLSPSAIVHNAVGSITETGSDALASVRGALSGHPVMLAVAGLAIGVSLLARSRIRGAKIEYGDSYAAYADYDETYADDLDDRDRTGAAAQALGDLQYRAHVAVDDSPLAVIAVGLAAGALLGTLVPVSATESELIGDARKRLAAAGRAAVDAAKNEFDVPKLLFGGSLGGLSGRASLAAGNVALAALGQFAHRPATTSTPHAPAGGIAG